MPQFTHLHCHTQFSLLDGAADIDRMLTKAQKDNMKAVAITDHGNMFGVFKFVATAVKYNVKPIVGCEFYLVDDRTKKQFTKNEKDNRYHQLLLAKDAEGYKNLIKLCSLGYIEGFYSKYPRIDKQLILQYHQGLIATTCCLAAEVPRTIIRKSEEEAEKVFKWWLDLFGEDYYVELQRHGIPQQDTVNEVLLRFAKKYNVKIIATNDSHYVDQQDYNAHDILLCINTGKKQSDPKIRDFGDDEDVNSNKGRFAFYNDQFYFKTSEEMTKLFSDLPQAIDNTNEIADKVQSLKLKQDIMLPNFRIPAEFKTQDDYLRHLTLEGARKRYKEITREIEERIHFELHTIRTMGYAGYFLIVADFINHGKDIGVFVGPGRGSAAGSVVAYCLGITNIDPIHYGLLFERFLNPERKSMPDIDTDFDDEGREKVLNYVVEKYGKNQVAQIITYGTMAAKMSIKDVARVLDLPLSESLALAKLVPERPGIELNRLLQAPFEGEDGLIKNEGLTPDEVQDVKKLRDIFKGQDLPAKVLKEALVLEGSVRGTGIHAAGIIIAPKDLTEIIPVCTAKDSDLYLTQFEGKIIEEAGVVKMDFLGLKTLTILRDALALIRENHGIDIDIDKIPLDDKKTFELYQRAMTNGTFQFESPGMQKYLKELKPDKFDDLIAMNALYRPGPMEYIPNYINRKHGKEPIRYDLPEMEEFLKDTYGVTVYQEQVMLLSQKLAGFTKGDADVLRKAMGKKDRAMLDKMKGKFMEGTRKNGYPEKICEKIWTDWEAFAQYAFNKSHSTCYALVAFQTAYLKAHYPAEYMAAVLTHGMSDIEKVNFFLKECKRLNVQALGPDINESDVKFTVNKTGQIRMALSAIKGVGEAAVAEIVKERRENGPFKSIFDFAKRVNLRSANKKTFESLAYAGAFDCFGKPRSTYFHTIPAEGITVIEKAIRYGGQFQKGQGNGANTLFGDLPPLETTEPKLPEVPKWGLLEELKYEKDYTGIYISAHPLDDYRLETETFARTKIADIEKMEPKKQELTLAGIITKAAHRITKKGTGMGIFTLEDYTGSIELGLYREEEYLRYKHLLQEGVLVFVKGTYEYNDWLKKTEVRLTSMLPLSEVRQRFSKDVTLTLPFKNVNDDLIRELERICHAYPGRFCVRVLLRHDSESYTVELSSSKYKIDLNNELLGLLEGHQSIECKLNVN
ncbi:MAG TPA: DNA polymerase III subunit alpha [Chitinophagales bacterium]|nr:DNA polymerase III subunit alpha [Chitinophagales bacterium]